MTRRGSLIYYLTAWICGCFFMSLAIWTRDLWNAATVPSSRSREAFGVLFFYFYGLVFGALAVLIGAFLLRRLMTLLKCKTPLHWAVAGAILAPLLIGGLGAWGVHVGAEQRIEPRLLSFLLLGPTMAVQAGWWLAIPAGAATGFLLCRVQRAFGSQQPDAPSASS
ncbi:MAG: hypothetical protein ACRD59_09090 [Candidatus Acidiferrales bacterium]